MALLESQYEVWATQFSLKTRDNRDKRIRCCPLLLKKDATPEQEVDQGYIMKGGIHQCLGAKVGR
jgi:hypothetical protein